MIIVSDCVMVRIAKKHGARLETVDNVTYVPFTNVVHKRKGSEIVLKVDDYKSQLFLKERYK